MTDTPARSGTGALLTYYDDATGERTTLTAAELGAWSAATAALLVDGCGLRPGRRAAVLLPPHWQISAVLLGAWSAGIEVSFRAWSTAGLEPAGASLDVSFVEHRRIDSWLDEPPTAGHQFVLGLRPDGEPLPDVPRLYLDYITAVRPYLGAAPPRQPVGGSAHATVDGTTYGDYGTVAAGIAARHGITAGDRVLVDAATSEQPLVWLLAPLSVGASVVLCANLDRSRLPERIAAEHVTRVL